MRDEDKKFEYIGLIEISVNNEWGEVALLSKWVTGHTNQVDEVAFEQYQREFFANQEDVPVEQVEIVNVTWSSMEAITA